MNIPREATLTRQRHVHRLTEQGWTAQRIAEHLGTTRRTVARDRAITGCAQQRPPSYTPAEIALVEQLLDDGWSYNEIGREIGRRADYIAKRFPGRGWTTRQIAEWNSMRKRVARL